MVWTVVVVDEDAIAPPHDELRYFNSVFAFAMMSNVDGRDAGRDIESRYPFGGCLRPADQYRQPLCPAPSLVVRGIKRVSSGDRTLELEAPSCPSLHDIAAR